MREHGWPARAERRPYERKPLRLHEVLELVEGALGAWERDVFGRASGREAAVGEPAEGLARGVPGNTSQSPIRRVYLSNGGLDGGCVPRTDNTLRD